MNLRDRREAWELLNSMIEDDLKQIEQARERFAREQENITFLLKRIRERIAKMEQFTDFPPAEKTE